MSYLRNIAVQRPMLRVTGESSRILLCGAASAGAYKSRRLRLALAHTLKDDRGVQHGFSIPPMS